MLIGWLECGPCCVLLTAQRRMTVAGRLKTSFLPGIDATGPVAEGTERGMDALRQFIRDLPD